MRFTDLFLRRPVLAIVVNLIIIIAGIQAVRTLNVRQYPKLESASISVTTVYVGANAELVRGFITTPLERVIAAADGIDYIESQSVQGLSTINVRLKLNFNASSALADISARVDQVRADLPPEAQVPAISAWLKPERMAALNVSPAQVSQALGNNNYLAAVGQTKGALVQVNITAATDLKWVDEFKKLVIRAQNGSLVRLSDVADVELGADTYEQDVRMSGKKSVFMGIWVLPNANSLDVIAAVKKEMATLKAELPTGMQASIAFDSTKYINSAITDVQHTLLETIGIVIIVIFLFLGSLRTVLVPLVSIPVSLNGAIFL